MDLSNIVFLTGARKAREDTGLARSAERETEEEGSAAWPGSRGELEEVAPLQPAAPGSQAPLSPGLPPSHSARQSRHERQQWGPAGITAMKPDPERLRWKTGMELPSVGYLRPANPRLVHGASPLRC